jgi:hypothetical protein
VQEGEEGGKVRRTAPRAGYVLGSSTCSADILLGLLSRVVRKDFAKESSVILEDCFSKVWGEEVGWSKFVVRQSGIPMSSLELWVAALARRRCKLR